MENAQVMLIKNEQTNGGGENDSNNANINNNNNSNAKKKKGPALVDGSRSKIVSFTNWEDELPPGAQSTQDNKKSSQSRRISSGIEGDGSSSWDQVYRKRLAHIKQLSNNNNNDCSSIEDGTTKAKRDTIKIFLDRRHSSQ
jgi:hypothetical protein